jgi:formylglycine-generating enzyme required for sulfatase activity
MNLVHRERPGRTASITAEMVWIEAGTFRMGSNQHYPEERPAHHVSVAGFSIDTTPVMNAEFCAFVEATGHVTCAEIGSDPKDHPGARSDVLPKDERIAVFDNDGTLWSEQSTGSNPRGIRAATGRTRS